ncbi:MAG: DUF1839 family protein [Chloroflexi bacterium]|nr:DUF1839 family protein [Chloroflexota bacterium]
MSTSVHLFGHDPATYRPHAVHDDQRSYPETNCYTDILIELLHARGDEPLAMLGSNVRADFEGDQWTFFKPSLPDVELLFGVDIHEMQPYRPLPLQIGELLQEKRTLTVEVDAWYLPDTVATSYRTEHVKTSIAVEAIDRDAERLRYYHNRSLFELGGEDYRGLFRIGAGPYDELAPYTELVRFDMGARLQGNDLRAAALHLLRGHLSRLPDTNPFLRFGERLEADLPAVLAGDVDEFHRYAFATIRMAGAGFELTASHVDWLLGTTAAVTSAGMMRIVEGSKLLGFKLARRRPFDPGPIVGQLASAWDEAMAALVHAAG